MDRALRPLVRPDLRPLQAASSSRSRRSTSSFADIGGTNVDPALVTVFARVKKSEDAVYVRDEILEAFAERRGRARRRQAARGGEIERPLRLRARARQHRARSPRRSPATCASSAPTTRSTGLPGRRRGDARRLQAVAKKYFTDENLVVTTLSQQPMPEAMAKLPSLASLAHGGRPAAAPGRRAASSCRSGLPQLKVKLLFTAGSAARPQGKGRAVRARRRHGRRGRLEGDGASTRSTRPSFRWPAPSATAWTRR